VNPLKEQDPNNYRAKKRFQYAQNVENNRTKQRQRYENNKEKNRFNINEYIILDILSLNEIDKHNILIVNGCIINIREKEVKIQSCKKKYWSKYY